MAPPSVLIDTNNLFRIFPFNINDLQRYRLLANLKGLPYAKINLKLAAFDIATSKFSWQINAFVFLELLSIKPSSSKLSCADQIIAHYKNHELNLEKKLDKVDFEIACLLGACIGADIKDCYIYIFAIRNSVAVIVSEDKDIRRIDRWLRQESPQNLRKCMVEFHHKYVQSNFACKMRVRSRIKHYFTEPNLPKVQKLDKFVEDNF